MQGFQRILFYGLVGVVALVLLLFTVTFKVRFTENAVVTTLGSAGDNAARLEPGLHFKLPYPIQSVTTYDTRLRVLETRSETQQTADDRQIVVQAFCTWRVSDPLEFFKAYSNAGTRPLDHYRKAEDILGDALRSALSEASSYRLQDLFTRDADASRLGELEGRLLAAMVEDQGGVVSTGIEITSVGVSRIVLPEATTQQVINRMRANRERLAQEIRTEGESLGTAIEAAAQRDASLIRSFAEARAAAIRSEGISESAPFLEAQRNDLELAIFLEHLEFMKSDFGKRTTLVLSMSDFGFAPFRSDFLEGVESGQLPDMLPPNGLIRSGRQGDASE